MVHHQPIFLCASPRRHILNHHHYHSRRFNIAISTSNKRRKQQDVITSQASANSSSITTVSYKTNSQQKQSISSHHADSRTQIAQFLAGAMAGLVNTLVLSPLDVVKTRLQAQGSSSYAVARYHGLIHALRRMLREEGFRSYYRGLPASICAFVPNWAIYWYTYERFKLIYTPPGQQDTPLVHISAAVSAGGITAVSTAPFWTLKSRMQVDGAYRFGQPKYRSVTHGFRTIIKEEGITALYRGLTPTLFGLGHVAIQFPLYEYLKKYFSKGQPDQLRAEHVLVASSVSKIVASAVFYPHEVLRTRIQTETCKVVKRFEPGRVVRLFQDIMRKEGVKGLYRGFGTNMLRTVPACMLTFTSYEVGKRYAERYVERKRQLIRERQVRNEETLAKKEKE